MNRGVLNNRRGQITIFVILAIVIVAVVVVIFAFPQVNVFSSSVNPSSYLISCIEPEINNIKETLSAQGGYSSPTNYAMYQDAKIQYLCYTSENYVTCTVQQPLLIKHVENEVKKYIEPRAKQCLEDLKSQYERRGYTLRSGTSNINVNIVSEKILIDFIAPITISKDEETQTFQRFAVSTDSNWYDLLAIAVNIIQYESTFGDSETSLYMSYYPNLRIEKVRRDDGSTIYQLSDVNTDDRFTFATRSLVWPQGLS